MGLIKFLMIAVNVVFWAFGGTLLGVGIWMAVDDDAFDGLDASGMDDALWAAAVYTMIGVGAGVFLIGFLGCAGAWKGGEGKKNIMLKMYIGFVSAIILAEIVVIILTAIFWGSINDSVRNEMQDDVKTKYGVPGNDGITTSWDKMQYKWKCCGSYDFTDYEGSQYANYENPVAYTCCVYELGGDYENRNNILNETACYEEARGYVNNIPRSFTYLNARGCYDQMANKFEENAAIIIGVTCGVLALQILGMIFACCIMND